MPFEPLNTDEKLEGPVKLPADMDTAMLGGCSSFVITAILFYGFSIWPFFVLTATYDLRILGLSTLLGGLPALGLTVYACRKAGLPGGAGAIGGAFSVAIFLFLRLKQLDGVRNNPDFPEIQFPNSWVVLMPATWGLITLLVVVTFLRREHFDGNDT